jgi:hypothetical protein
MKLPSLFAQVRRSEALRRRSEMFGFSQVPCVVCDRPVSRRNAVSLEDRRDIAVCKTCLDRWITSGAICKRCQSPVRDARERGIFLDRYVFGHYDCGATRLAA